MKWFSLNKDNFICYAVLFQPLFLTIQSLMIYIGGMDVEATTPYRVALTAFLLLIAISITIKDNIKTYIITYVVAVALLLLHTVLFIDNGEHIWDEALRFTLPVVIPSCLCLLSVTNIKVFEKCLTIVSWVIAMLGVWLLLAIITGNSYMEGYSMALSYALLLPMMHLMSLGKIYNIIASLLMFTVAVLVGNRGSVFMFLIYVVYHNIKSKKSGIIWLIIFVVFIVMIIPSVASTIESVVGVSSRTLNLLEGGELLDDSGRGVLYDNMLQLFWEQPIIGIGLFGDRVYISSYCHNIILEIFLNWGALFGFLILLYSFYFVGYTYLHSDSDNRDRVIKYILAMICPLMFSSSYLINYNVGLFIGCMILIRRGYIGKTI